MVVVLVGHVLIGNIHEVDNANFAFERTAPGASHDGRPCLLEIEERFAPMLRSTPVHTRFCILLLSPDIVRVEASSPMKASAPDTRHPYFR